MTVFCCKKMRTTNFCPDCGDDLRSQKPLVSLLHHCQMSYRKAVRDRRPDHPETPDRWAAWVAALKEALDVMGVQYYAIPDDPPSGYEEHFDGH